MRRLADGSTSPTLLREVSDWRNHPAWAAFWDRYDPQLRRWCRGYGLNEDAVEEVSQRIWVELAERMRSFQYDPTGTFRGWLRRLCESRAVDFLRQRQAVCLLTLDERDGQTQTALRGLSIDPNEGDHGEGAPDQFRLSLLDDAETVQAAVKAKVKPWTWDAFWLVAICDWTVARTAEALGMTHTAVYAARERVARMLRDKGKRVMDGWPPGS